MRGKGKTNYLKNRLGSVSPLFIIDIRNEYTQFRVFKSYGEFLTFAMNLLKGNGNHPEKMQYRFAFSSMQEYVKLFYLLAGFSNCTIVVDEADAIFSEKKFVQPLLNVFLGSRNNGINMIFVGKRPFLIPIFVRSQADEYVIFGIEEANDIRYLEHRTRIAFPKPPEKLERGEAIIYRQGGKPELVRVPKYKEGVSQ